MWPHVAINGPVIVLYIKRIVFCPVPPNAAAASVCGSRSSSRKICHLWRLSFLFAHFCRALNSPESLQRVCIGTLVFMLVLCLLVMFMNGWCGGDSFNQQSSVCLELICSITNAVSPWQLSLSAGQVQLGLRCGLDDPLLLRAIKLRSVLGVTAPCLDPRPALIACPGYSANAAMI